MILEKSGKKSFTLIEMLIVIAILGILTGVIYVYTGSTKEKARDARRKQDLDTLSKAIDLYALNKGYYPPLPLPEGSYGRVACSNDNNADTSNRWKIFSNQLADYISKAPLDPLNKPVSISSDTQVLYAYCYFPEETSLAVPSAYKLVARFEKDFKAMASDGGNANDCGLDTEGRIKIANILKSFFAKTLVSAFVSDARPGGVGLPPSPYDTSCLYEIYSPGGNNIHISYY